MIGELSSQQRAVLIVPEQSSFHHEKSLLDTFGAKKAKNIEVLSFRKLCRNIFDEFSGLVGRRIDDGIKSVLMSMAIENAPSSGGPELFRSRGKRLTDIVDPMLVAVNEYKMCMISPEKLAETAKMIKDDTLRAKLMESASIYAAYNALLENAYDDPDDDLIKVCSVLEDHDYFGGMKVFIDSFNGFSAQELAVISHIFRQAEDVCLTICCESGELHKTDTIFSEGQQTLRSILRIAAKTGKQCRLIPMEQEGIRFRTDTLRTLEQGVFSGFRGTERVSAENDGSVILCEAADIYEEVGLAAAQILRLVNDKKMKFSEIAVLARSLDDYKRVIASEFPKYGIPFFLSDPEGLVSKPLLRLLLSAFEAVLTGFDTEALLRYAKTRLTGLSDDRIFDLENYAYVWSIRRKRWREPFTMSPSGTRDDKLDSDIVSDEIKRIEESRRRLMDPLLAFEKNIKSASGGDEITAALYKLTEDIGAVKHFRGFINDVRTKQGDAAAAREASVWDVTMEMLDSLYNVMKGKNISPADYYSLLRLYISKAQMSEIPRTINCVTVGTAGTMRCENPTAVLILGAIEGVFPSQPGAVGIFTDSERRFLREGMDEEDCLPLYDSIYGNSLKEKYITYSALCAPRDILYVSWYCQGAQGELCEPSVIKREILSVLPETPVHTAPSMDAPDSELFLTQRQTFDLCAEMWNDQSSRAATLREYYLSTPGYSDIAKAIGNAAENKAFRLENTDLSRRLYGTPLRVSSTKLDDFAKCRFAYFCKYGIQAQKPRKAEMDGGLYGTAMHYLFERFLSEDGVEKLLEYDEAEIRKRIRTYLDEYVKFLGDEEERSNRFRALCSKIRKNALRVMMRMKSQFEKDTFRPVDFELRIGATDVNGLPAYVIDMPTGDRVEVYGFVDRVDAADIDGSRYVRIIDYKTGEERFKMSNIANGIKIQMLLYLLAVLRNGSKKYGNGGILLPAGVLYVPASLSYKDTAPANEDGEKLSESAQSKELKYSGLLLDNEKVLDAMEKGVGGEFIPVDKNKDGKLSKSSSVVSAEIFDRIFDSIEIRIKNMAESLYFGEIDAFPEEKACEYCDYRSVCRFEDGDPVNIYESLTTERAIEKIIKETERKEAKEDGTEC